MKSLLHNEETQMQGKSGIKFFLLRCFSVWLPESANLFSLIYFCLIYVLLETGYAKGKLMSYKSSVFSLMHALVLRIHQ